MTMMTTHTAPFHPPDCPATPQLHDGYRHLEVAVGMVKIAQRPLSANWKAAVLDRMSEQLAQARAAFAAADADCYDAATCPTA